MSWHAPRHATGTRYDAPEGPYRHPDALQVAAYQKPGAGLSDAERAHRLLEQVRRAEWDLQVAEAQVRLLASELAALQARWVATQSGQQRRVAGGGL